MVLILILIHSFASAKDPAVPLSVQKTAFCMAFREVQADPILFDLRRRVFELDQFPDIKESIDPTLPTTRVRAIGFAALGITTAGHYTGVAFEHLATHLNSRLLKLQDGRAFTARNIHQLETNLKNAGQMVVDAVDDEVLDEIEFQKIRLGQNRVVLQAIEKEAEILASRSRAAHTTSVALKAVFPKVALGPIGGLALTFGGEAVLSELWHAAKFSKINALHRTGVMRLTAEDFEDGYEYVLAAAGVPMTEQERCDLAFSSEKLKTYYVTSYLQMEALKQQRLEAAFKPPVEIPRATSIRLFFNTNPPGSQPVPNSAPSKTQQ